METQFVYIDSSEEEDCQTYQLQRMPSVEGKSCPNRCTVGYDADILLPPQNLYEAELRKIVTNAENQVKKTKSKLSKNRIKKLDQDMEENIDKRNSNYQFFAWKMEMDKKYKQIQDSKVTRLKEQNDRKKQILNQHMLEQKTKTEANLLQDYIVQKKEKETRTVNHLKQQVRKLGVERVNFAHKKVKEKLQEHKQTKQNELISQQNKHRDQLQQLREIYVKLREEKRVNEMDQKKVIKQLRTQVFSQKQQLSAKLQKKTKFQL